MNYKDPKNKAKLQKEYESLFKKYDGYMKELIDNSETYKKSALLFYWLRQFLTHLKAEPTFKPKYLPELKKGNVVKVDFGFNVGNELGGLHYAIVLNDSSYTNGMVTVIPLSSLKEGVDPSTLKRGSVFLGTELYDLLSGKLTWLQATLEEDIKNVKLRINTLINSEDNTVTPEILDYYNTQIDQLESKSKLVDDMRKEIKFLKEGSVALTNQIRAISKMRIEDPKRKTGILYGLRYNRDTMQIIKNELMKSYGM